MAPDLAFLTWSNTGGLSLMSKTATKTRKVAVDAVSGRSAATVRMYCARFSRSSALKILRLRRNFRFSDAIDYVNYLMVSK